MECDFYLTGNNLPHTHTQRAKPQASESTAAPPNGTEELKAHPSPTPRYSHRVYSTNDSLQ